MLCVRWYLSHALGYHDLEELMTERGLPVDHTIVYRRVLHYAPLFEERVRARLKQTCDLWRVDENYAKVHGDRHYLSGALDAAGTTPQFMLSSRHVARAAAC